MINALVYMFVPTRQRRACSYPGLIYAAVVSLALALAVILTARSTHAQEADPQRAALVHVGPAEGGSGVCISPDGYILTAAHCVQTEVPPDGNGWRPVGKPTYTTPAAVKVRFPNQEPRSAKVVVVWGWDRKTDLALLKVDVRGGLPWLAMAKVSPGVGEDVTSIGYPAGHFARFESDVTFVGPTKSTHGVLDLIQASHRGNPGHSGGPLLNRRGEVCGICSMGSVDYMESGKIKNSPQLSLWARCEYFGRMIREAGVRMETQTADVTVSSPKSRIVADAWYSVTCVPCHKLLADVESGKVTANGEPLDQYIELVLHDIDKERDEAARQGIAVVPTFVVRSTGEKIEGYDGPDRLNAKITQILNAQDAVGSSGAGSDPQEQPAPPIIAAKVRPRALPQQPQPQEATVDDAVQAKPDFTGVQVFCLVRRQGWADLFGNKNVQNFETQAGNYLKKKLVSGLGAQARVEMVFERMQPTRFANLVEATGLEIHDQYGAFVVLTPKLLNGVAGVAAGTVEGTIKSLVDGKWKFVSVKTVAERADPNAYQSALAASETEDIDAMIDSEHPTSGNWFLAYIGAFSASCHRLFFGVKQQATA